MKSLSRVRLFVTPWTVAHQAPPSMGFFRQFWSALPFPFPGDVTTSESDSGVPIEDIDVWNETVAETPALQSAVNAYFKSLVDAVSRTAQFSIAKYHIDAISTCFLYGSGAGYKKIDKELARQLGTQVEILKSLSTVNGPKDFVLGQFVNCCGDLIRHD